MEYLSLVLFVVVCCVLLTGYPVAFALAGTSLLFAFIASLFGVFDSAFLHALPSRIFGIMNNQTLLAVPLFVFMGVVLEKSKIAESLLVSISQLFSRFRGGLAIAVVLVGALLAASTGIVGATVVTMGLLSLPAMLKQKYNPSIACGSICAVGTLGQIIPPSIALVLLGDVISNAFQQSQLDMGIFSPETVSVGDLFVGAIVPGVLLVALYLVYLLAIAWFKPEYLPAFDNREKVAVGALIKAVVPPVLLIFVVLGSILAGFATPTEAAAIGAFGALLLALFKGQLSFNMLASVNKATLTCTSMVFLILIGASVFSLVFRGLGGEELIESIFESLPGGVFTAMLLVMVILFLLGFILDFIEITFVVVPIVAPVLLSMGLDPIWLGIMIAINLQTSFLTPPFGFALFYLRGVADASIRTAQIYKGVMPFIVIQLFVLVALALWPELAIWLPSVVYSEGY
ncbi:TRAP-type mannitol/chloroaromatic compound transporter large permease [Catenovulum agarivorans DS-2]|uniref:TRAP transporter large permease protein n=1 Tax=Catenovulum agarivorans DS-2 TaxID=1328313 RepID=W7R189_9ALTE|nr:TRAP transporter large permease subunit [Catenovulum agarivorans]EWH11380.1 TRAP-type mannitol/chloroaromatic compound transporter large permease [Catenovulum agarivorans DS-2]